MVGTVQLETGMTRLVHFPIIPIVLGKVKVSVVAESVEHKQSITKTVTIKVSTQQVTGSQIVDFTSDLL